MSGKDLQEFKADHTDGQAGGTETFDPVTPEGGKIKKRRGDVFKDTETPEVPSVATPGNGMVKEDGDVEDAFASLFEGMDITEEFKSKVSLVFDAAVNEAASAKVAEIEEAMSEDFDEQLSESVSSAIEDIVENLDNYLDYAVSTWMEENKLAIDAGIKVEMAESFMEGLKTLFYEHNVEIDENTIDVVADLEEELASVKEQTNDMINENIALSEKVKALQAIAIFEEMTEGLTVSQAERFRVLAENVNVDKLEDFRDNLGTLKESFFKAKAPIITEELEEEQMLSEDAKPAKRSPYDNVNAIAAAISSIRK